MPTVYTTAKGVQINVQPGSKSPLDFIVKYREPGKRERTPKHIHIVVDIFGKRVASPILTNALLDHVISMIGLVQPATAFPPHLRFFSPSQVARFSPLDAIGEYSVEFLLVVVELIMTQERTNYPSGRMTLDVFTRLRSGSDIYSVVSKATLQRR